MQIYIYDRSLSFGLSLIFMLYSYEVADIYIIVVIVFFFTENNSLRITNYYKHFCKHF